MNQPYYQSTLLSINPTINQPYYQSTLGVWGVEPPKAWIEW